MPSRYPAPGKSFADVHPELLDEWDYERNLAQGRTPETTTPRSAFFAAWICRQCGHRWTTSPRARSKGGGCKACWDKRRGATMQKPPPGGSLADISPVIAADWDMERNRGVTPRDVYPRSEIKRWWKCAAGHGEFTSPKARSKRRDATASGCTVCTGRRLVPGVNDLATTHPHIAAEWDTQRNAEIGLFVTEVSRGSGKKAWWHCRSGHLVETAVKDRVKSAGCGQCHTITMSRVEIDIRCELHALGVPVLDSRDKILIGGRRLQIDVPVPDWKLAIEFDGRYWHGSQASHDRDRAKIQHLHWEGWTTIRMRDCLEPLTDLDVVVDINDGVLTMVQQLLPAMTAAGFAVEGAQQYLQRTDLLAAETANQQAHVFRAISLASEHPALAAELDPALNDGLQASALPPGSSRTVTWRCGTCGHQWTSTVLGRAVNGHGCQKCQAVRRGKLRRTPLPGQSLADQFPDLLQEWDEEKNTRGPDQFRPFSGQKVWWRCPHGHSYQAVISARSGRGRGCPVCDGKQVLVGFNDLATTHPWMLKQWDYEKNAAAGLHPEEVSAGSDKEAVWFCLDCGCEKTAKIIIYRRAPRCWDCGQRKSLQTRRSQSH